MRIDLAAGLALVLIWGAGAEAAPKSELWARWTAHDAASIEKVDHRAWDRFLETYVVAGPDRVNRVAYALVTDRDERALAQYLAALSAVRIGEYSRAEQFAYWVNLYNALTVKLILDHYPLASIRDISASPVKDVPLLGLLGRALAAGPWDRTLVRVEGVALTLDDIEHRILRPIWRDPRIHYAVNCAAVGCPELIAEAFTRANAERLLEAAARAYVNHPRGVRVEGKRFLVSSLYHWYGGDFGDGEAGLRVHLKHYAGPELAAALAGAGGLGDGGYDWSLNDADKR